jgi:hypothetical protein
MAAAFSCPVQICRSAGKNCRSLPRLPEHRGAVMRATARLVSVNIGVF